MSKKLLLAAILVLTLLLLLMGCAQPEQQEVQQEEPATPASLQTAEIDNAETGIGVAYQEYTGDDVVEILLVQYNGQQEALAQYNWKNPEIEALNREIEAGPLQIYQDYLDDTLEAYANSIEIRSYPFVNSDYVQIVTSCIVFPETYPDQYTRLWSWCFSKQDNRSITLDEILEEQSLTGDEIAAIFAEWFVPTVDNEEIVEVKVAGFVINDLPSGPATNFLLEVMLETESDPYKSFFMYIPEYDEIKYLDSFCLFYPDIWGMAEMNPPLSYANNDANQPQDLGGGLTVNAEMIDDLGDNEYIWDDVLYAKFETFALADQIYGEEEVAACIKELEGDDIRIISLRQSDEHSLGLPYPAWLIEYEWGANEDTSFCTDIYVQTDTNEYRLHTSIPVDSLKDYAKDIPDLLATVKLEL